MNRTLTASAVIVAAGGGTRFGGAIPKQFEMLGSRPVFVHALSALASVPEIRELILVLPAGGCPNGFALDPWIASLGAAVPILCVAGGSRRQDSVAAGLAAISQSCEVALVHDAARPFPPEKAISQLIQKVCGFDASRPSPFGGGLLALRASGVIVDTVKKSGEGSSVEATLDRGTLWLAQTPQAIAGAHIPALIKLLKSPREFTDESAALEQMGVPVALVEGSTRNFKITRPEDLQRAESLLRA